MSKEAQFQHCRWIAVAPPTLLVLETWWATCLINGFHQDPSYNL